MDAAPVDLLPDGMTGRVDNVNSPTTHPASGQAKSCVALSPKDQIADRSDKVNDDDKDDPCPLRQRVDLFRAVEIDKAENVEREHDNENWKEYCHRGLFLMISW